VTPLDRAADRQQRLDRELHFQQARAAEMDTIVATPPAIIARYRECRHWRLFPREAMYHALQPLHGKQVLDFGCGTGEITTQLALLGARHVTGFDLSPALVSLARRRAELDGVTDRVTLTVADGEDTGLPRAAFDVIICYALLHHTDIAPVLDRVHDALAPGGTVCFYEPVAFLPALQWLRDRLPVPKEVSPDERQLTLDEIRMVRARFPRSRVMYFRGVSRLERLLGNGGRPYWATLLVLRALDRVLFALPGGWRLAGGVLVIADA
jgi:2-polyprenyl-3-methyl-5-hydroxy-6-metoxy-1,4-benzoquinol methylase